MNILNPVCQVSLFRFIPPWVGLFVRRGQMRLYWMCICFVSCIPQKQNFINSRNLALAFFLFVSVVISFSCFRTHLANFTPENRDHLASIVEGFGATLHTDVRSRAKSHSKRLCLTTLKDRLSARLFVVLIAPYLEVQSWCTSIYLFLPFSILALLFLPSIHLFLLRRAPFREILRIWLFHPRHERSRHLGAHWWANGYCLLSGWLSRRKQECSYLKVGAM